MKYFFSTMSCISGCGSSLGNQVSHNTSKSFLVLNGSLYIATGLIITSELLPSACPVLEPS